MVAANEVSGAGEVRQLQVVAADRIPQVSHCEVASLGNHIERFFHHFVQCHVFRHTLWRQPHFVDGFPYGWSHPGSHLLLRQIGGRMQQPTESLTLDAGQPDINQPRSRTGQMLGHHHFPQVAKRASHGPFAAGDNPLHQVHLVGDPFMIEADFLQVVQQTFVRVPETVGRVFEQFPQRSLPVFQIGFRKLQCGEQSLGQRGDI